MRGPRSLRRVLLSWVVGGLAAVWAALAVATFLDARHHTGRILDAQLVELSEVLAAVAGHEAFEIAGSTTLHDPVHAQGCTYQVFSVAGELLLRSHDAPNTPLAASEGFSEAVASGVEWRAFRNVDRENALVVVVAHAMSERDALVRGIALRTALPLLGGLPLAAVALWLAVTRALRPLESVAAQVRGREAGRLAPLTAADAPEEIQPLVDALNDLLARLGHSLENERRFTGDAAHELRTPLAALKTQAEVALTTASEERRRHALQQVVAGTDRATRLVQQLLQLARLDAEGFERATVLDLAAPCREAVDELAPEARARGLRLGVVAGAPARVHGDATMLQVLARNLVENAIRHAPEGGEVRVSLGEEGGRVTLAVEDSGPGVEPELRERIFDRLYRAPGESSGGSGLGLSIARRIVPLHAGTVEAGASVLGGLKVTVSIPRAA
jgi:two-component system sensor histidine kinase QseC